MTRTGNSKRMLLAPLYQAKPFPLLGAAPESWRCQNDFTATKEQH
jgi:hypothetical protein